MLNFECCVLNDALCAMLSYALCAMLNFEC